eukprot:1726608-Rhodomonas_salina.1
MRVALGSERWIERVKTEAALSALANERAARCKPSCLLFNEEMEALVNFRANSGIARASSLGV